MAFFPQFGLRREHPHSPPSWRESPHTAPADSRTPHRRPGRRKSSRRTKQPIPSASRSPCRGIAPRKAQRAARKWTTPGPPRWRHRRCRSRAQGGPRGPACGAVPSPRGRPWRGSPRGPCQRRPHWAGGAHSRQAIRAGQPQTRCPARGLVARGSPAPRSLLNSGSTRGGGVALGPEDLHHRSADVALASRRGAARLRADGAGWCAPPAALSGAPGSEVTAVAPAPPRRAPPATRSTGVPRRRAHGTSRARRDVGAAAG